MEHLGVVGVVRRRGRRGRRRSRGTRRSCGRGERLSSPSCDKGPTLLGAEDGGGSAALLVAELTYGERAHLRDRCVHARLPLGHLLQHRSRRERGIAGDHLQLTKRGEAAHRAWSFVVAIRRRSGRNR